MIRRNRDWKSFNSRWGASRFEKFVVWSVGLHVVLAALFVVPARSARQQQAELQIRQQQAIERKERERKEAQAEAEQEIREMAKIELAEEQLKDLFGELTEEFFDEDISELMWDELLEWFDPELEELVDLLELDEFDQVEFELEIDELREKMVERLAAQLLELQQEQVAEQLQQEAREAARLMAESLQQQLRQQVAAPIGRQLQQVVAAEQASAERQLEAAVRRLDTAAEAVQTGQEGLKATSEQLGEQQRALAQAKTDGDSTAELKAAARVKSQSGAATRSAGQLKLATDSLAEVARQMASSYPAMSKQALTAARQAEAARRQAESAAQAAAKSDADTSKSSADTARQTAGEAGTAVADLRSTVQTQLAVERAAYLARMAGQQAETANEIAQQQAGSESSAETEPGGQPTEKPGPESAASTAAISAAVARIGELEQGAAALGEQLAQLNASDAARSEDAGKTGTPARTESEPADSTPSSESTRGSKPDSGSTASSESKPGSNPDSASSPTKSSGKTPADNSTADDTPTTPASPTEGKASPQSKTSLPAGPKSDEATGQESRPTGSEDVPATATAEAAASLKAAREALEGRNAQQAAEQLQAAQSKLKGAARSLAARNAQKGQADQSVGEQLEAGLAAMRRNRLAAQAGEEFETAFREQALPKILDRAVSAGASRAKVEKAFTDAFNQELRSELEKVFGEDLPKKVAPGDQIAGLPAQTEAPKDDASADGSDGTPAVRREGEAPGEPPIVGDARLGGSLALPDKASQNAGESSGTLSQDATSQSPSRPAPRVAETIENAEASASSRIARTVPGIAASAARHPALNSIGKTSPDTGRRTATLMTRLDNLSGQLRAGRRDALGDADSTAVAAALRRHRGRKGSLIRLGGLGDLDGKAFREMVEAMKARGQQTGQDFALATATGETSKADETSAFTPALIAVPAPVDVDPDEVPTDEDTREVEQPEFHTNRFAGIPLLEVATIKIDGDLSDWQDVAPLELDPVQRGARPPKITPKHQTAWVAYNSRGLLVAFNIADTNGQLDNTKPRPVFWLSDCVEIYVDTMNTKYSRRGETNTHQFFAFPFGHPDEPDVSTYEAQAVTEDGKVQWKHVPFKQDVVPRAGQKTEQGWTIELLIPKSILRKGSLKPGRIIGLNLQVDTGTDLYYFWTCAKQIISSQHPNTWGDVQFLGSDGRIELLSDDGTEADSLFPGQPLQVRIVDPDMNLNELRKDRIGVTVRTAAGDSEPLILEETESGSGIFEGSLTTTLAIGADQPDRLELFEGETVSVEYIDQAQAYGERNMPLAKKLTVSSIGVEFAKKNAVNRD